MRYAWVVVFLLCGCGMTRNERVLVEQTRQAGAQVAADTSAKPETQQAGKDVALNMETLQEGQGTSPVPTTYSPAASASVRDTVHQENQQQPGWLGFLGTLAGSLGFPGLGLVLTTAYGLWQRSRASGLGDKLTATYHGIESAAKSVAGGQYKEAIEQAVEAAHTVKGVKDSVKADLVKLGYAKA